MAQSWYIESVYKKQDDLLVKTESVRSGSLLETEIMKPSKLFDLNLDLRLKRTKAYYKLASTVARTNAILLAICFLAPVAILVFFPLILYFKDVQSGIPTEFIIASTFGALICGVLLAFISIFLGKAYRRSKQPVIRNNLNLVCNQNSEILKEFFIEFMKEDQLLHALDFNAGDSIAIEGFDIYAEPRDGSHSNCHISLVGFLKSDTNKSAELSILLAFKDNQSTLQVDQYTVKKLIG